MTTTAHRNDEASRAHAIEVLAVLVIVLLAVVGGVLRPASAPAGDLPTTTPSAELHDLG